MQGSHDSFVWRAPLPDAVVDALAVDVGAWGYENRIIYELERAGWTVGNPCLSIHRSAGVPSPPLPGQPCAQPRPERTAPALARHYSFHMHASGLRSGPPPERVNGDGRSGYARPAYHPQDARIVLVEADAANPDVDAGVHAGGERP